jgi:hypothetical protein
VWGFPTSVLTSVFSVSSVVDKWDGVLGKGFPSPLDGNLLLRQQQEIAELA